MNKVILTPDQKSTIDNCLLDFLICGSSSKPSYLPFALSGLLKPEGFGMEMSGIYISTDADPDNMPGYLEEGIAFEFMEGQVTLPFCQAVEYITEWCHNRVLPEELKIEPILKMLNEMYSSPD